MSSADSSSSSPFRGPVLFNELHLLKDGAVDGYSHSVVFVHEIRGNLNVDVFADAFKKIGQRHDAFRTAFVQDAAGNWERIVQPASASTFHLERKDLRHMGESDAEKSARQFAEDTFKVPFDRSTPPLVVPTLIDISDTRWWLVYKGDHVVMDGHSFAIALGEVAALYAAGVKGTDTAAVDLPQAAQPRDIAPKVAALLDAERAKHHQALLSPYPADGFRLLPDASLLHSDHTNPAGTRVVFPLGFTASLSTLTKTLSLSPSAPYLVALALGLRAATARSDVGFQMIRSGRRSDAAKRVVGCLAWGDACSLTLEDTDTYRTALTKAHEFLNDRAAWRMLYIPCINPAGSRVALNINRFDTALALDPAGGVTVVPRVDVTTEVLMWTSHDILMQVFPMPGMTIGVARYRTSMLEPATIAKVTQAMAQAVQGMCGDVEGRIPEVAK
ncbi:CoA-dependent acyltransferase [Gonapodya prolifera JEL478]|uniref:CoA-dependent acyltransferase n=1 Tax=Gonapodya prolifera (strain JEL478) TaxID=1344416 RepID=A0A139A0K8_GONPJ|nr:CoA-dependent acyltransferase [Gonapodya prolifera JEL478]|eukprot:KXS10272.1 CoA-dependent acyltransferase [Gonapodya prolifera JEL478]